MNICILTIATNNYIQGVGFELMQLRNDPIARYLAENGFNDAS